MGNLTGMLVLFSALLYTQDDVQDGSNNRVGNHMGFAMIDCKEKITDFVFRNGNVFCLCSGNLIHQSMHHLPHHFWLDLIILFS